MTRLTKRVRARLEEVVGSLARAERLQLEDGVLWRRDQDPQAYAAFRVPHDDQADPRSLEEVPVVEIANAARSLLEVSVSLPEEALAKEIARTFGIKRMGKKVRAAAAEGIALLERRGGCVRGADSVTLRDG